MAILSSNTANIKAVITAEDKASATLKKFGDNTAKTSARIKSALAVAGATALTIFGKQSVQAYEESETALTQLEAVLKSTGGTAGITKDEAIKLSKEIQKTTSISDEAALAVENMGLTFTKISKDIFPESTKAAIDMATAMNHGMKPSAEQAADAMKLLGKALQDPDAGLGALHRVGVNTDELKKKFEGITDTATKQKMILKELGTEFGGSATAQAKTFGGQLDQLKNNFNDIQETIGRTIVEALTPLAKLFSQHPILIKAVTVALLSLASAFIAVKVAAMISTVVGAAAGAITIAGKAARVTTAGLYAMRTATIAAAAPWAGLAAAAVAAAALVLRAIRSVINAYKEWDKTAQQVEINRQADAQAMQSVIDAYHAGKISKKQYQAFFRGLDSTVDKRAVGGPVRAGSPYLVGERGPEMIIPNQSGTVIPNNRINSGNNINISINAGAFLGNDVEARKFAKYILVHLNDLRGMGHTMPNNLLGV